MQDETSITVWDEKQIKEKLDTLTDNKQRYVLAGLFATGSRLREFCAIKKESIITEEDGNLKITAPNFKHKKVHIRTILIDHELEQWLITPILAWRDKAANMTDLLYAKSPRWLEHQVREWFDKHPHFFRHCRSTYNYNFWNMTDMQNMHFMGWTDLQPAPTYTHLKTGDLINVFKRKKQETKQAMV